MTLDARARIRRLYWCVLLSGLQALILTAASAQTPGLQVEHRRSSSGDADNATSIDAAAGVGLTLVFRVVNPTDAAQTAAARVAPPSGWQVLFVTDRLTLPPRLSVIDTVTVVPPRSARAGEYIIRYEVARTSPEPPVIAYVNVRVRERRALAVSWLGPPTYLAAGVADTLDLLVTNDGNAAESVRLDVKSILGSTVRASWTSGALQPGEARRVQVDVRPPVKSAKTNRETLTARVTSASMTDASEAGLQFDVVTSERASERPRAQLPTALALRVGTNRDPGFGSFVGGGRLDRAGQVTTDFGFLSREESHPLMLEHDRYYGSINAPTGQLMFGDQTWALTFLTESGHYGFGAGGRFDGERWSAGAFVDDGRRDIMEARQAAGFVGVRLGRKTRVSLQYLERFEDGPGSVKAGELGTARVELRPGAGFTGDFEVGTGRSALGSGNAVLGQIGHTSRVVTLYARRVRADATYPIRDRTALIDGLSLSIRPVGRLELEGTYDGTEQLPDETLPLAAPTRQRVTRAGIAWGSLGRVQASRRAWTSPNMDWAAGWRRESVSAQLGIPLGPVRLAPGVERGVEASPQYQDTRFSRNWLRVSVRLKRRSSVYARGEYGQGIAGNPQREVRRVSFGGTLQPMATTRLEFQLYNGATDAPWLEGTQWATATLDHRLPWRHHIVANYRRRTSGTSFLPSSEAYRADYVIPFGIPLKQKAETGRVTLRVRDGDTGQARARFLVQVAGASLLTDSDGVADFTDLAPGDYYVTAAPGSLGPDHAVVPSLPLKVTVIAGRRIDINAAVVRTSTVSGTFKLFRLASGSLSSEPGQSSQLIAAGPVAGAVIELVGNGERRVAVTDAQGRFEFNGVTPGDWHAKVVQVTLPPFYQVDQQEIAINVFPGQPIELRFRAVPKSQVSQVPVRQNDLEARMSPLSAPVLDGGF